MSAFRHRIRPIIAAICIVHLSGCGLLGCEKYASQFSCDYVENKATYEVWYWENVEVDDGAENKLIGKAVGLPMCRGNAIAYAEAVGDDFSERSYICVLIEDGETKEKHRLLSLYATPMQHEA